MLTGGGAEADGFHACALEQCVCLLHVGVGVGGVGEDLGAELSLRGAVAGEVDEEEGEDGRGDVDVGEEDLVDGVQKLAFCDGAVED